MDSGPASHPAPPVRLDNPTNIQLWVDLFTTHTRSPSPFQHNNSLNSTQKTQNKCLCYRPLAGSHLFLMLYLSSQAPTWLSSPLITPCRLRCSLRRWLSRVRSSATGPPLCLAADVLIKFVYYGLCFCRWLCVIPIPPPKFLLVTILTGTRDSILLIKSRKKSGDHSIAMTSEVTDCDLVLLGLIREKKGRTCIWDQSESPALSSVNPRPQKLRCTALSSAGRRKPALNFTFIPNEHRLSHIRNPLKFNIKSNNNLDSIKRTQKRVIGDKDVMEENHGRSKTYWFILHAVAGT